MRPDDRLDPEQDAFLERVAAPLRAPVELSDRVERTVLARLRAGGRVAPAPLFRPLAAAALAASIAAVFALGVLVGRRTAGPVVADGGLRTVEFVLRTTADSA